MPSRIRPESDRNSDFAGNCYKLGSPDLNRDLTAPKAGGLPLHHSPEYWPRGTWRLPEQVPEFAVEQRVGERGGDVGAAVQAPLGAQQARLAVGLVGGGDRRTDHIRPGRKVKHAQEQAVEGKQVE